MDHLRTLFRETLAEESNTFARDGQIFIREHRWTPDVVLEGMLTPEAFEASFEQWIEERNEERVLKADDLLQEYGQQDRFLSLAQAHKRGSVIPFVGSGLSIPSGYPGWSAFLRRERMHTNLPEADLEAMLGAGQYEEAAEELARQLGPAFNEAVHNAYGVSRELRGVVQYLPFVFESSVVTTNFDDVLKRCFDKSPATFTQSISGADAGELPRLIASGERVLLKLHGLATTGRGRILTKSEYDKHYATASDAQKAVEAIFAHSLLFMGCGLTVDRTLSIMRAIVKSRGHDNLPRHYAFLADPGSEAARNSRRDQLVECNIYPIWYPDKDDDDSIEAYLIKLNEAEG